MVQYSVHEKAKQVACAVSASRIPKIGGEPWNPFPKGFHSMFAGGTSVSLPMIPHGSRRET